MTATSKGRNEQYPILIDVRDMQITLKNATGATLYIQWKCGTQTGIAPRAVCKDSVASLGSFHVEEKLLAHTKKYKYQKLPLTLFLLQVLKTKKQAVGKLELDISDYLETPETDIHLPMANGEITFKLIIQTAAPTLNAQAVVQDYDTLVSEVQYLEEDITAQLTEREQLNNVLQQLQDELVVLRRNRVAPGDVTMDEYQCIVSDIFLSKMTFSDKQHPLTADILFDRLNEQKMIRQEKQKFLELMINSLKAVVAISLETPKRNVYWVGVLTLLVKRVHTEFVPKNLSDKNIHTKFLNKLLNVLSDSLLSTFEYIRSKCSGNALKYFTDTKTMFV